MESVAVQIGVEAKVADFPLAEGPAFGLQRQVAALQRRNALLEALIDNLTLGVALIDRSGHIDYRNRMARQIFARRDGLWERDGMLTIRSSAALRVLAMIGSGAQSDEAVAVPRDGQAEPYSLLFARRDQGSQVLMLIRDPQCNAAANFAAVRRHFGLTGCETSLLEAMTFGERLADFCRRRGISRNTGKFHLRALFAKTGTNRQADLIRRSISLLASFAPFG
jgi:DNA-binding CsgD family transcriptional regulator